MSTVPSYRFEMDMLMRASPAAPGPAITGLPLSVPLFMEGEYVHPDRLRLSSGVKGSPRERFEAVIVGGSYYLQHPASRQWLQVPAEEALLTEPQTMVDPSELLDYLQVPSAIRDKGIESIGGLRTRRLAFDIDRERMQALAERRPPARAHLVSLQEPRVEIWIGEADGYTYRMTVEMIVEVAYEGGDQAQARIETFVDIWLSDFGRSFDIQAPLAG